MLKLDLPKVAQSLDFTCGAACFDSMFLYFKGFFPGEMHFAQELGTLTLGYTALINIVTLARNYEFCCEMREKPSILNYLGYTNSFKTINYNYIYRFNCQGLVLCGKIKILTV